MCIVYCYDILVAALWPFAFLHQTIKRYFVAVSVVVCFITFILDKNYTLIQAPVCVFLPSFYDSYLYHESILIWLSTKLSVNKFIMIQP